MDSKALDRPKFVRDWFDEWAVEPPVYGWATELLDDRIDNAPEVAWQLVIDLIEKAPGDEALGWVAAGPLEDLPSRWGPDFIERLEALARSNDGSEVFGGGVGGKPNGARCVLADAPIRR